MDENLDITPVEYLSKSDIWVKRDDMFSVAGISGGKVRTCWHLAQGARGLCTAGSRSSPQANIVAHIAKHLGIPCRVHTPTGELSPELLQAQACGAEVVQHKPGYNSVIIARARADAEARGWTNIPFGMECEEAVEATAGQVCGLPTGIKRIVMPVGSGMSLAGVLTGLETFNKRIPVLGVMVGAAPHKRLDKYGPLFWYNRCKLVFSGTDYHKPARNVLLENIRLDSHYEAKCLSFLQPGDLMWIVGIRKTEMES